MKIAVLVSGGVDSSVALRLLQEEGHELTAFYLKIWLEDELSFLGECPWEDDLAYVRAVCEQAHVPLVVVPFQKEYWARVVAYTIAEAQAGRTPNPDMLCNARIKFGAFYEAFGKNFDKVATGHYAWTEERDGKTVLMMSPDPIKDQTYFLSQLSQAQVAQALFPIGKYEKREVRELASEFKLPNAARKDSQGICFLGKIPFDKFLEYHLGKHPGQLIEYETKKVLGGHDGFWYFTVGQRRGIKLHGGPWYVVAKKPETNEVFISHGEHHAELARDVFIVGGLSWIAGSPLEKTELQVKIRHGAKMYPAAIEFLENDKLQVTLKEKDQGVAAGQFAVLYDGKECLGGGMILE
ncbi:MAG: tRNA 2-thiouridine(34) synthase MnmA [Candidatus Moraniibacteriota bacterium]